MFNHAVGHRTEFEMVLVVCERPAERRREDAKGGSAPPSPPQQGSPPPCEAKFPLERKELGENHPRFP